MTQPAEKTPKGNKTISRTAHVAARILAGAAITLSFLWVIDLARQPGPAPLVAIFLLSVPAWNAVHIAIRTNQYPSVTELAFQTTPCILAVIMTIGAAEYAQRALVNPTTQDNPGTIAFVLALAAASITAAYTTGRAQTTMAQAASALRNDFNTRHTQKTESNLP